ncbi:MAG TPA: sigma-54 dependent transcriptional regulator, partial [Thermoanaerobaculia bacterium]|nr:sigma-54 dependent transcriptional regulator [Thermoanaerobaculia bacterium]
DSRGRVLIVDDDAAIVAGLEALLCDEWEVRTATNGRDGIVAFGEFSPDVVLLDVELGDASGLDLLQQFKMYTETVEVVMMSGVGTFDRVVEAMKLGAGTFLQKPFEYKTLEVALAQASQVADRNREMIALRRAGASETTTLPGVSPSIKRLNEMIASVAKAPSSILVEGESGTGKGVLAKIIHEQSPRSRGPFVDLNCAGLSKELLESELFGHEKGAFTNAMSTKPGLFEIAGDGSLFLDEIGEMEITVQARVLKALEDKRFRRVGGVRDLKAGFRLIAATNRDLQAEVAAGRFRGDLYYRLNVVRIRMPPLRERLEDVPILADALLRSITKELGRRIPKVSPHAMKKLQSYPWPGNVRELRNVLERAMLTLPGDEIRTDDLLLEAGAATATKGGALPAKEWEIEPLDDVMTQYVAAAVKAAGGNVRAAARRLKISPSTLYSRLPKAPPE